MIAPNNIHPPKNWQDFEMLCLKLWGEIWQIPDEIELNSDNSQGQEGVDIYGPVEGGLKYNGIQCKNKKLNLIDGSPNRITVSDIDAEIQKAKSFQPALNKLVIATSLPKDKKVEEFVRCKSVENVQAGLFSIQICFWEFFERKLPEYQRIFDWYLKNENFHRVSSVSVVFSDDGSTEKIYRPKFQKTIERSIAKPEEKEEKDLDINSIIIGGSGNLAKYIEQVNKRNEMLMPKFSYGREKYPWHQNFWFRLRIKNTGQSVLEDFKLEISVEGDFNGIGAESRSGILSQHFSTDVRGYNNSNRSVYVKPTERTLVQGDSYSTGSIYLTPLIAKAGEATVYWRILARDFEDKGKLTIKIEPVYHRVVQTKFVKDKNEEGTNTTFSLIQRPGQRNILDQTISFSDSASDYDFSVDQTD